MADAKITVGADATGVEKALAVGVAAVKNFANEAKSAIGGAVTSITSDLANVALAQGKVSFTAQHQQVREFEASSARMGVSVGRDLQSIRAEAEGVGLAIGKRPGEVTAWASEVGKLTGNFSGALAGMKGIAELAADTGKSTAEYRGLAVELQTVGRVSGDTSQAVALLKTQADSLGVSGGVAAFAAQVEGLGDAFSYFAVKGEKDFGRLTELAGKLGGGGANQQTAQRIQQSIFGNITSNSFQWSRFLGRDIYDKNGNLEDPNKTVGDITSKIEKTYKSPAQARRALMLQFGSQAGARLHNLYQSGELYQSVNGKTGAAPAEALKNYLGTDAGKREEAQAQLAVASDKLLGSSSALGSAADKLQAFAANNPITSTFGATVAGGLVTGGVKAAGSTLGTVMKVGGANAGTAGSFVASRAIPVVGAGVAGFAAGWEMAGGQEAIDKAYEEERTAKDPAAAHRLNVMKEARDRIRAARGMPALPGAMNGWTIPDEDTALARNVNAPGGQEALAEQFKKEKISAEDAQVLARAIAEAMKSVNIQVQSTPDNPLTATVRTSQSSAAGNQGGT